MTRTSIEIERLAPPILLGLADVVGLTQRQLVEWQNFYRDEFGIELNLSTLIIPEHKEGLDRLIVIAEGVTIQLVYDQCGQHFNICRYFDYYKNLNDAISVNDRDPKNGTYAIWVRDTVEADEQFSDRSGDDLQSEQHVGITVLERLIYELKYFKETGNHLDIKNVTLCSGSRGSTGRVPSVDWDWSESSVYISWYVSSDHYNNLRSREVAS
jgi:hypothetical protein